jgi:cell wall-associated NlpC family hydrolase
MMRPSVSLRAVLALVVVLLSLLSGACASTGGVPRPFPIPGSARGGAPVKAPETPADIEGAPPIGAGYELVGTALSLRGTPYRNGGSDTHGFDCSGFTQFVYAQYGVALPREVREQFEVGAEIEPDQVEAGDLLFFTTVAPGPTHVAIAIGGDQFVHAPSSTGVVRVERLSTSYWATRYLGARRVMPL